jgi:ribonuclease E
MHSPTVQLKSGGYIVINPTEALVAIDVNSGRATKERNIEETAYRTNLEAAEEVACQLRLRDLAGLIVIDFIDMDDSRNARNVERRIKEKLKSDRARIQVGRISAFGLLEMSRQRLRPSLLEASTEVCAHCEGSGVVRSTESSSLHVLRAIEEEGILGRASEILIYVATSVAIYLLNQKRSGVLALEERFDLKISIAADPALVPPDYRLKRVVMRADAGDEVDAVVGDVPAPIVAETVVAADADAGEDEPEAKKRRRRGKRGGRRRRSASGEENAEQNTPQESSPQEMPAVVADDSETQDAADQPAAADEAAATDGEEKPARKRRRRSRRRRGSGDAAKADAEAAEQSGQSEEAASEPVAASPVEPPAEPEGGEPSAEPEAAEPVVAEPIVAEPIVTESVVTEPIVTEPIVAEPVVAEPITARPAEAEPAAIIEEAVVEDAVIEEEDKPARRGWWQRK